MKTLVSILSLVFLSACAGTGDACDSCSTEPCDACASAAVPAATAEPAAFLGNTTCPMSGKPVKEDLFVEHDGQRAYYCCNGCVKKASADPAAAVAAAYPTAVPANNTACPVTGEAIKGTDTVTWQGHQIAICCPGCAKTFAKNPAAFAAKALGN